MTDRKTFAYLHFNGLSSLTLFINDLRTEMMEQQGWGKLVSILTKNCMTVKLLDRFNSISETEMMNEKSSRTPEEYNLAKNMYIAVWQSLASAPKRE